jgi:hypothetical protein
MPRYRPGTAIRPPRQAPNRAIHPRGNPPVDAAALRRSLAQLERLLGH